MPVTMEKIARRARVGRTTVSRAFSGDPEINKITKGKILAIAKELDYRPHGMARGLAKRRTYAIGVVILHMEYLCAPYIASILGGIGEVVDRHHYSLVFSTSYWDGKAGDTEPPFMRLAMERRVDGLIIVDQWLQDSDILRTRNIGVPLVLVDRKIPKEHFPCVMVDNYSATYEAAEYLIGLGHSQICFLTGAPWLYEFKEKLRGYRDALEERGIGYREDLVAEHTQSRFSLVLEQVKVLLKSNKPPTAILCGHDGLTLGAVEMIHNMGLKIPQDVSIIGYTNPYLAFSAECPITVVDVPCRRLGKVAASMMIRLAEAEKIKREEVILNAKLVLRESCRRLEQTTV
jgi:DNA-binding LacI/PurR family transcriptional regulator